MNPNGLVPTLEEEDGFLLWESNSIVRYLAAKHRADVLEPADLHARARASAWMDWQLSVLAPAITPVFLGLDPHAAGKAQSCGDRRLKKRTTAAMTILDAQLPRPPMSPATPSPTAIFRSAVMANRYRQLVPERPPLPHFERWYAAIAARPAFKDQVAAVPLA